MTHCSKHRHKSKGAAEAQRRALVARGGDWTTNPETLCTYYCSTCAAWHCGHNEMRVRPEPMPVLQPLRRGPGLRRK
jgi:hypothetical protein